MAGRPPLRGIERGTTPLGDSCSHAPLAAVTAKNPCTNNYLDPGNACPEGVNIRYSYGGPGAGERPLCRRLFRLRKRGTPTAPIGRLAFPGRLARISHRL